ncbi:group-specific protein [Mesobacillus jeotgali]|uniref:Group-specific protein n=1 Tax=Mesobacillus jeotgali TaxID=129985 RepID=A0ABY9VLU5_9BACI|nr:group-specific protein [Mesobacillus jeotgali]WNF24875.1 group-specific protein [Mesobacillus jeotgali]
MKKFYVASSFRNMDAVNYVTNQLVNKGYVHTYDWTKNAQGRDEKTFTFEDLKEIGQKEKDAVIKSDFIVVLLPGGKGTHIELGIALGLGKKTFLYSLDGALDQVEKASTFYHLPEVEKCYGKLDELVDKIAAQMLLSQEIS